MFNKKRKLLILALLLAVVVSVTIILVFPDQSTVDEILDRVERKNFSGVVLVAYGDEISTEKGYGFASCDESVVNTTDTVYAIGSITKMFTAVAVAQLEERDMINIDNPVSNYLENMPEDKSSITIRQLLDHTAGLETYHETGNQGDFEPMTRNQAFNEIMRNPLRYSPGDKFSYSNSGYTLLAVLIETVSGMDYTNYVRDNILVPAGMTSTGFWGECFGQIASTPNVVLGYSSPDSWEYSWVIVGNGGMVSTAADLHRWVRALKGNSLLTETAKERIGFDEIMNQGFGSSGGSSQHEFNATIEYNAKYDITVVVLSNRSTVPAESFGIDLLRAAIREKKLNK
ncbi:MAG: beta-lactamase family protein [Verrucomicrobia bacterium]|nr:beta-lactamase family protein [Verrucomicrobiota bacterium]MCF7707579.1 beta-lactamase family protein [Verrucomicrobiota bacterium]